MASRDTDIETRVAGLFFNLYHYINDIYHSRVDADFYNWRQIRVIIV